MSGSKRPRKILKRTEKITAMVLQSQAESLTMRIPSGVTLQTVDEKGIKAAAATAIIMEEGCAEIEEVKEFTANQPFTYMILTDSETPELLFQDY